MNAQAQQKILKNFWQGLFIDIIEQSIVTVDDNITVDGYISGKGNENTGSIQVHYQITLSQKWDFIHATIHKIGDPEIEIKKSGNQWFLNGEERADLKNCLYIDINLTPFTNSLPINNLELSLGESRDVEVVYIDLFSSEIKRASQRYSKLNASHFKYESLGTDFKRILEVDNLGFVIDYPGLWKRLNRPNQSFLNKLVANQRAQSLGQEANMYDWLIGSWGTRVIDYKEDGTIVKQDGECHFSWVLEGRAIQDLWIVPRVGSRSNELKEGNRYGTTIRVFNPQKKIWEITWINPVNGVNNRLEGKKVDGDLVHTGLTAEGHIMRWSFKNITDKSFYWIGELSTDEGNTWKLQTEYYLTRDKTQ